MTTLKINGETVQTDVPADMPLLWVLRDALGMTGTKFGCGRALCGACTVLVDGVPRRACITPVAAIEASEVMTIEALGRDGEHPLQVAWRELDVPQCGYCQSGQLMAAYALLQSNLDPSDEDIDTAMAGNLCRCGAYMRIRAAIKQAAAQLKAEG